MTGKPELLSCLEIFERFWKRIKSNEEAEYILYTGYGAEKWLQFELYLAFKGELFPAVYNENWNAIEDGEGYWVSDICFENSTWKGRHDIVIAETPFLEKILDGNRYAIIKNKDENKQKEAREAFEKTRWHYIELKLDWHKCKGGIPKGLKKDINKLFNNFTKPPKKEKVASYTAISLVRFIDAEEEVKGFKDINDVLVDCKKKIRKYCRVDLKVPVKVETKAITPYMALICAYKTF